MSPSAGSFTQWIFVSCDWRTGGDMHTQLIRGSVALLLVAASSVPSASAQLDDVRLAAQPSTVFDNCSRDLVTLRNLTQNTSDRRYASLMTHYVAQTSFEAAKDAFGLDVVLPTEIGPIPLEGNGERYRESQSTLQDLAVTEVSSSEFAYMLQSYMSPEALRSYERCLDVASMGEQKVACAIYQRPGANDPALSILHVRSTGDVRVENVAIDRAEGVRIDGNAATSENLRERLGGVINGQRKFSIVRDPAAMRHAVPITITLSWKEGVDDNNLQTRTLPCEAVLPALVDLPLIPRAPCTEANAVGRCLRCEGALPFRGVRAEGGVPILCPGLEPSQRYSITVAGQGIVDDARDIDDNRGVMCISLHTRNNRALSQATCNQSSGRAANSGIPLQARTGYVSSDDVDGASMFINNCQTTVGQGSSCGANLDNHEPLFRYSVCAETAKSCPDLRA